MSSAYGIKAIKPTDAEHVLGFASARTGGDDALLEIWNGSTNAARVFRLQKDGNIQAADGAVATPAYAFETDLDTGMYLAGLADLRFAVSGADVLTLGAAGITLNQPIVSGEWQGTTIAAAYLESHTHPWANITSTPTTLAGYGITDAASSSHTHALNDLSNVTAVAPNDGDHLVYNTGAGAWQSTAASSIPASLTDLSDVTITSPATAEVIRYNGSAWVDAALVIGDITSLQTTLDAKIVGPGSSTDNALVRFDGATGKLAQNSGWTLDDSDVMLAADNILQRVVLKDFGYTAVSKGSMTGTVDFNLENGNFFYGTVTGNITTLTFSNPPASGTYGAFVLKGSNMGAFTITWPASVIWSGGAEPSWTASGEDLVSFSTVDGGTNWLGQVIGLNYA